MFVRFVDVQGKCHPMDTRVTLSLINDSSSSGVDEWFGTEYDNFISGWSGDRGLTG
jgi:hypothetical protein